MSNSVILKMVLQVLVIRTSFLNSAYSIKYVCNILWSFEPPINGALLYGQWVAI